MNVCCGFLLSFVRGVEVCGGCVVGEQWAEAILCACGTHNSAPNYIRVVCLPSGLKLCMIDLS